MATANGYRGQTDRSVTTGYQQALGWPRLPLTHAGHAGNVQLEAIKAVAGIALPDMHTASILAAVEDPALLSLQLLKALEEA